MTEFEKRRTVVAGVGDRRRWEEGGDSYEKVTVRVFGVKGRLCVLTVVVGAGSNTPPHKRV